MQNNKSNDECAVLRLHVIDRDGFTVGHMPVKIGINTREGRVTRFTEKTVWTLSKDGIEKMHRAYDGCLPVVYRSNAPADGVQWKSVATWKL